MPGVFCAMRKGGVGAGGAGAVRVPAPNLAGGGRVPRATSALCAGIGAATGRRRWVSGASLGRGRAVFRASDRSPPGNVQSRRVAELASQPERERHDPGQEERKEMRRAARV